MSNILKITCPGRKAELFRVPQSRLPGFALVALITLCGAMDHSLAGESTDYTNGKNAASVLGKADFTNTIVVPLGADSLANAGDVQFDPVAGKLYVADTSNNRVLRYNLASARTTRGNAEAVLGQPDFTTIDAGLGRSRMDKPYGLALGPNGELWVADYGNHRVLRFDNAATKVNGANADAVLGQGDFASKTLVTSISGMSYPIGLATFESHLWVADSGNNRVLRFDNAEAKADGDDADGVLGQGDFVSSGSATTQSGLNAPFGVFVDSGKRLWVADSSNSRVLRFDSALNIANGANAGGVLGQIDFTSNGFGTSASIINFPFRCCADQNGTLWVTDKNNGRVLRFENAASKGDGGSADGVLGKTDFTSFGVEKNRSGLGFPTGIALGSDGDIWVADENLRRVTRFKTDSFQPDNQVGAKKARQKGNNTYNTSAAGQIAKVKVKGNRSGKAFFTVENDGDVPDTFTVRGTKGNAKLKVKYVQSPGGNVTGAITRGAHAVTDAGPESKTSIKAIIKGTRKSRGRGARRTLVVMSASQTDGEPDTAKAKVKKTP